MTSLNKPFGLYESGYGFESLIFNYCLVCIGSHYFLLWFDIKAELSLLSGPSHILKEVDIVRQMKGKDAISKKIKSIAMKRVPGPHI